MKALTCWLCIGAGILVAIGCGGDDEGGSSSGVSREGGVSTSVSRSKQLGDLTDAEAQRLCESSPGIVGFTAGADFCEQGAVLGSSSPEECEMLATQCREASGGFDTGELDAGTGDPCEGASASSFEGCTLTVGELEDCIRNVMSFYESLSCERAGSITTADVPQCFGTLQSKCPSVFGGDSAESSG